jgi:ribonuclease Z
VLDVRAVGPDGEVQRACFSSRHGFEREPRDAYECEGDVLHDEVLLRVRGRFVDHEMPCLAFAIEEKSRVRVAKDRLDALGVATGAWLRDLKQAVIAGAPAETPIAVRWRDRLGEHEIVRSVAELSHVLLDVGRGQRIGYVTDVRFTEENRQALAPLLADVDQLFIESVFLDTDREHALRKNHLTARQAGSIAREVGAKAVVPFHFSPRYRQQAAAVIDEVQAAWLGRPEGCESTD